MKKFAATILSLFSVCVLASPTTSEFFTPKAGAEQSLGQAATVATETKLLSPSTYEQYLSLTATKDVSINETHTAIADGKFLHVYDRAEQIYRSYEHDHEIVKTQLYGQSAYYLDDNGKLFSLALTELASGSPQAVATAYTNCGTFCIRDGFLYYTVLTIGAKIVKTDLSDGSATLTTVADGLPAATPLAFWQNELCYFQGNRLYRATDNGNLPIATFPYAVSSMAIAGNTFACSTNGEFYAYNLTELRDVTDAEQVPPILRATGGFTALCSDGDGYLYAVKGNSVRQFSVEARDFTEFEISAESDSLHRLNGGKKLHLSGDRLFIADNGNARVSVYDTSEKKFLSPIPSSVNASHVASSEKTLLVAGEKQAAIYSLSETDYGTPLFSLTDADVNGNLVGATGVYGAYYLVTDTNRCYKLFRENGEWTKTETLKHTYETSALSSDVYGFLYTVNGNALYRYSEKEFSDTGEEGVKLYDALPAGITETAVDYERNVYALCQNTLYKFSPKSDNADLYEQTDVFPIGDEFVYGQPPNAISFALCFEESATYLLYDGNYIAETNALRLPTMKTLPVGDADEQIFSAATSDFEVVQIQPASVLIEFNLGALKGAEYFPYVGFHRCETARTALKIGQTSFYDVLAVFDETAGNYSTYLVLSAFSSKLPETDYRQDYAGETVGYITNAVSPYKYPCLNELLTLSETKLERGAQIKILGKIEQLDYPYYQVEYMAADGTQQTGYVPVSYVALFNGVPPQMQTTVYGETESDKDSVWRLTYLLLGAGAICILTDFLLLRSRKNEKDE